MSFTVGDSEIVGYIGPNGAGKSTSMKIMTGILRPTSGKVEILGMNPYLSREKYVRKIGAVFGNRSNLIWDLPVMDSFSLLKKIYSIPEETYRKNFSELTEMIGIEDLLSVPVRQLSLGQRMRCEIVSALLHAPEILFLDEPTLGLDARSKVSVHKFIKRINKRQGVTVILTTHDMADIEALTERVIVIGNGKKLYDGNFLISERNILQ